MAFAEESDTQAATISTEHTLNGTNPDTTECVMTAVIDTAAMVLGDVLEIAVYEKAISSGTQRVVERYVVAGVQAKPCFMTDAFHMKHGWRVTLTQTAGTGRSFPWSLRKVT